MSKNKRRTMKLPLPKPAGRQGGKTKQSEANSSGKHGRSGERRSARDRPGKAAAKQRADTLKSAFGKVAAGVTPPSWKGDGSKAGNRTDLAYDAAVVEGSAANITIIRAGGELIVSPLPSVLAEAMALIAPVNGEAHLPDGDLLRRCEQIAGEEQARTLATGIGLAVIRSKKLFGQQAYPSFEPYVRERWGGFSRTRMTKLIEAAKVYEKTLPFTAYPPEEVLRQGVG